MTITTASAATIGQLNARAAQIAGDGEGQAAYDAAYQAANEAGFIVADGDVGGDCTILVNAVGEHVNLWRQGRMSQRVEEGGIGFDDQVEWYEEYLASADEAPAV